MKLSNIQLTKALFLAAALMTSANAEARQAPRHPQLGDCTTARPTTPPPAQPPASQAPRGGNRVAGFLNTVLQGGARLAQNSLVHARNAACAAWNRCHASDQEHQTCSNLASTAWESLTGVSINSAPPAAAQPASPTGEQ